jgi:AcrR family transcriptional regulator
MTPPAPQSRTRRVDAERNREKILTATRLAFADPEADVSMAEISRRAGVGMATLYRNFANRRELLEALYVDEVDGVCEAASTIDGATPGAIFTAWLKRFFVYFASKRHVAAELLEHSDSPVFGAGRPRVLAAGQPLLTAAQHSHEVREDLTLDQILDMVAAIAKIQAEPSYLEPILHTALDGLHPGPTSSPHRTAVA